MIFKKATCRALSALCDVLKIAFIPAITALGYWEVLKLVPYFAAFTIYKYYQVEWYWLVTAISAILFLIAAVRIQLRFKGKYNDLEELYTKGVELRNKYVNSKLNVQEAEALDEECENWEIELYSIIKNNFPNYKSLFRPLKDVTLVFSEKNPDIDHTVFRIHNERLIRIDTFFKENRSIK